MHNHTAMPYIVTPRGRTTLPMMFSGFQMFTFATDDQIKRAVGVAKREISLDDVFSIALDWRIVAYLAQRLAHGCHDIGLAEGIHKYIVGKSDYATLVIEGRLLTIPTDCTWFKSGVYAPMFRVNELEAVVLETLFLFNFQDCVNPRATVIVAKGTPFYKTLDDVVSHNFFVRADSDRVCERPVLMFDSYYFVARERSQADGFVGFERIVYARISSDTVYWVPLIADRVSKTMSIAGSVLYINADADTDDIKCLTRVFEGDTYAVTRKNRKLATAIHYYHPALLHPILQRLSCSEDALLEVDSAIYNMLFDDDIHANDPRTALRQRVRHSLQNVLIEKGVRTPIYVSETGWSHVANGARTRPLIVQTAYPVTPIIEEASTTDVSNQSTSEKSLPNNMAANVDHPLPVGKAHTTTVTVTSTSVIGIPKITSTNESGVYTTRITLASESPIKVPGADDTVTAAKAAIEKIEKLLVISEYLIQSRFDDERVDEAVEGLMDDADFTHATQAQRARILKVAAHAAGWTSAKTL